MRGRSDDDCAQWFLEAVAANLPVCATFRSAMLYAAMCSVDRRGSRAAYNRRLGSRDP
jgi:hypothetical protein